MIVKYFGKIAELTNVTSDGWMIEGLSVEDFKHELFDKYPVLETETIKIAVNLKIEDRNFLIKNEDEVAILPPFSGG